MAVHDYVIDNSTGANVRADINNALAAIVSNNSSSSEPSTTKYAYMWWADTTNGILKIRNSANDGWVELLQLDGTLTLEDGTNSAPALAFRDDLNTGIFSSAADTFNVATGGVERMELGATTIFNEGGEDVDFRIEGDTEANLFFVDAGNNRIGIGTNAPAVTLDIEATSPTIRLTDSDASGTPECDINGGGGDLILSADRDNEKASTVMQFLTDGSTAMTINSSQQVGIGTASPSGTLDVVGSSSVVAEFKTTAGGGGYLAFQMGGSGANIGYLGDSQQLVSTGGSAGNLALRADNGIELAVGVARKVRIDSDGMKFGTDTAAVNALNDYEEGTFTPTTNAAQSSIVGAYTKIGRQVTIHIRVVFSSQSGSTVMAIESLPFTADMSSSLSNGATPSGFGYISTGTIIPQIHNVHNSTTLSFYNFNSPMTFGNVGGTEYRFGFVYHT